MFNMKKLLISLAFLGLTFIVMAADINYNSDPEEFLIYNRRNSKIYNYFLLKPSENISCTLVNIDTLNVYSRSIMYNESSINSLVISGLTPIFFIEISVLEYS